MGGLIHFYEDERRYFTWMGPKWIYEILLDNVLLNSSLVDAYRDELENSRYIHYFDFSDKDVEFTEEFKFAALELFDKVDSGQFEVNDRKRFLISVGSLVELASGALNFRGREGWYEMYRK